MTPIEELKSRLDKTNLLLDKFDEKLALGEISENQYKQVSEKYQSEANNLKLELIERLLLNEVGLEYVESVQDLEEKKIEEIPLTEINRKTSVELEKAGFWRRFTAAVLDGIIVNIIQIILLLLLIPQINLIDLIYNLPRFIQYFPWIFILIILVGYAYYIYFWGSSGQTPGKKAVGVKIVRTNGEKVGYLRSFLRYPIGYFISGVFLGIGFFWIAFDRNKQGFHDKLAGTFVIRSQD